MSLYKILKKNSEKYQNKTALIVNNIKYSYKEIFRLVNQTIANLRKHNFKKKDVVVIVEDNTLCHIISLFALSFINCSIVPTGTYYSKDHLKKIIRITGANSIIGSNKYCQYFKKNLMIKKFLCTEKSKKFPFFFNNNFEKINHKKKINIDNNFIITFSSGSTSEPKPIIFSQKTKIIRSELFRKLYKINAQDNIIITSPIDHSLGMRTLYVPLLNGATCVMMNKFNPSLYCQYIKKYKITFSVLVANQIYEISKNNELFKNFYLKKGLISASTKLYDDVKNKIIKKKINLFEMYGAAEVGTVASINVSKNKKKIKSVGKKYDKNIDIKILANNKFLPFGESGEIVCKTPGSFKGYLKLKKFNNNSFFKKYFKTGDVGYLDKDNYLYFLSRKKNIIRKSGITIYPEDIEKIFQNNKYIKEAVVVGKETKKKTSLFLFILKNKKIKENYIKNLCLKKLSTFQLPDKILFVKKFPKTNLGKIDRKKLLKLFF